MRRKTDCFTQKVLLPMLVFLLGTVVCVAQEMELITEENGFQWYKVYKSNNEDDYVHQGVQDLDGREIVPLSEGFDYVSFDRGFFSAVRDRVPQKRYYYSLDGEKVIGTDKYDKVLLYESEGRLYFVVEKDGKNGACDVTGKEVVAPKYNNLTYIKRDYSNEGFIYKDDNGKYQRLNIQLEKPKCSAKIQKVWVEQAYTENGDNYMMVFCNFSVKGLANEKALVQMRIKDSKGKWHKMKYARQSKDGSYYYQDEIKLKSYHTVYRNFCFRNGNDLLKLKSGKQYEVIIYIHSWTDIGILAESAPISFTAAPPMEKASHSTYTSRTYTPVQVPTYNTKNSSNSNVRTTIPNRSVTQTGNASYSETSSSSGSSYNSRTSRTTHSSSRSSSYESDNSRNKRTTITEQRRCYKCSGSGDVNCPTCRGKGRLTCGACKGRGYWTQNGVRHDCNACNKGTTQCYTCHGKGTRKCTFCSGKGYKLIERIK